MQQTRYSFTLSVVILLTPNRRQTVTKFQIGHTYYDRSACDHECIFEFTILARTAKTVTINNRGKISKRGLNVYNGIEQFKPFGTYSMCAIVSADKEVV
jgi:ribosomal protein S8